MRHARRGRHRGSTAPPTHGREHSPATPCSVMPTTMAGALNLALREAALSRREAPHSLTSRQPSRGKGSRADTPGASGPRAIRGDRLVNVTSDARTMGSKGSSEYRARQRERERRRRRQPRRAASELEQQASDARVPAASARQARRAAATACGWCAGPIALRPRGPIPKWCSATCRHRAWEQARAAASGRAAVQVVERIVVTAVEKPVVATPRHNDWIELLGELSRQLDRGVVYDRDLPGLARALEKTLSAFQRRLRHR